MSSHNFTNLSISSRVFRFNSIKFQTIKTIITSIYFVFILVIAIILGSIIHLFVIITPYIYKPLLRIPLFKYLERKFLEHNLLLFEEIFVFNKLPFFALYIDISNYEDAISIISILFIVFCHLYINSV